MRKKFSSELCVYCSAYLSAAPDHVVARSFFLERHRVNLPQVPCCNSCNDRKSHLEHYLSAVLPLAGRHGDAKENVESHLPRRFAKNQALARELYEGKSWLNSGEQVKQLGVPLRTETLLAWLALVARGLIWHHWKVRLSSAHVTRAVCLTKFGEAQFQEKFFTLGARERIHQSLGEETFTYEGIQATEDPMLTVWLINLYGGIHLAGDPAAPNQHSVVFGVITAPKNLVPTLDLTFGQL